MFGIGEMVLVVALLVLFFGAKRIPQIAKGVGEGIRNFRHSIKEGEGEQDRLEDGSGEDNRLNDGQDR
jgi:sec-independent protein translocase protein TatA